MSTPAEEFRALRRIPASLEAWWLEQALEATGTADPATALERLEPLVSRLSDSFTAQRPERFDDYGAAAPERAAYALWFGAQGWVRTRLPLADAAAARGWRPESGRRLRVLDVGAGSGAAGLSAATWLTAAHEAHVELLALDRSRGALAALEDCARAALPDALRPSVATRVVDARAPGAWSAVEGPFDLIVVSFALNELFPLVAEEAARTWLLALTKLLGPAGLLLLLEPAPKPFADRLVRLAAAAVEHAGLAGWGPALGREPWRPRPDARTWPHEVRGWQPPESLERLNRRLWRSARELTYAYALLGRAAPAPLPATPTLWRLASPLRRLRGRLTWLGYHAGGALQAYEVQQRDLGEEEREALRSVERGDLLEARALRPLDGGRLLRLEGPAPLVRWVRPEGERRFSGA